MSAAGVDSRLLEVLGRASSLELLQLKGVIERMLADPKRSVPIRLNLHLGQAVRFMDWRDGRMCAGTVLAMKETQATIQEEGTRIAWSVPYTAIEPPAHAARAAAAPEPPAAPQPGRNDFRCGEKVAFEDKYLNTVVGTIVRINQRTASIDPGDGTTWRVGFPLLRHVVDI